MSNNWFVGEGGRLNATSGEPSGVTRAGRAQERGEVLRSSKPQGSTHIRLPTARPLRGDIDLDGETAGVGTAVLVMVEGSWGKTARP